MDAVNAFFSPNTGSATPGAVGEERSDAALSNAFDQELAAHQRRTAHQKAGQSAQPLDSKSRPSAQNDNADAAVEPALFAPPQQPAPLPPGLLVAQPLHSDLMQAAIAPANIQAQSGDVAPLLDASIQSPIPSLGEASGSPSPSQAAPAQSRSSLAGSGPASQQAAATNAAPQAIIAANAATPATAPTQPLNNAPTLDWAMPVSPESAPLSPLAAAHLHVGAQSSALSELASTAGQALQPDKRPLRAPRAGESVAPPQHADAKLPATAAPNAFAADASPMPSAVANGREVGAMARNATHDSAAPGAAAPPSKQGHHDQAAAQKSPDAKAPGASTAPAPPAVHSTPQTSVETPLSQDFTALQSQTSPAAGASVSPVTASPSTLMSHGQPPTAARTAVKDPAHLQVAQQIVRQIGADGARFQMRLDPPELGRVDVRLEFGRDRRVTALVSAESPGTLTDLARSSRELERILEQSGFELSENGLDFSLMNQGQSGEDTQNDRAQKSTAAVAEDAPAPFDQPVQRPRPFGLEAWRAGRLDILA